MKNSLIARFACFAAICCVSCLISPATAAEVDLPSGITVTAQEDARNQILIAVGNDVLAVDAAAPSARSEQGPRFALATGAVEWASDRGLSN